MCGGDVDEVKVGQLRRDSMLGTYLVRSKIGDRFEIAFSDNNYKSLDSNIDFYATTLKKDKLIRELSLLEKIIYNIPLD